MEQVIFYTRLYFLIISQYIKARMQYKADFFISTFGMLMTNAAGLFSFWVVFRTIPVLKGWNYYEICFIYAFSLLAMSPVQIFFDNLWQLRRHLTEGTFIKYYFKPLPMLFYYTSEVFDLKGLGQLAFGVFLIFYAGSKLTVVWDVPKIVFLLVNLFSASLILVALLIMAAASGFWILNSQSLMLLVTRFRDFARYPTGIFNSFFRFLFTFVIPIGFIAYYPCLLIVKPVQANFILYFSPLVGLAFYALAVWVWKKGTAAYSGTGS